MSHARDDLQYGTWQMWISELDYTLWKLSVQKRLGQDEGLEER